MAKAPTPDEHSFTEEEISKKAYELSQTRNGSAGSAEANWYAAIEALKKERSPKGRILRPFSAVWRWTGFGDKKLWDYLQLAVGISIPIVIFIAGQEFTKQTNKQQQDIANERYIAVPSHL